MVFALQVLSMSSHIIPRNNFHEVSLIPPDFQLSVFIGSLFLIVIAFISNSSPAIRAGHRRVLSGFHRNGRFAVTFVSL